MLRSRWKVIILCLVLVISSGFFINKFVFKSRQQTVHDINPDQLYLVTTGNLQESISVSGYINPVNEREVSFRSRNSDTRDTVESIKVKEGDLVEKGDLLVILDKTKEKLSHLRAENNYQRALINGSENDIKEAQIELQMAVDDLAATELTSPITGLVTNIQVEEGDNVSGGTAAINIIDNSRYEVEVSIPESDISRIKSGLKAIANFDALPDLKLTGEVVGIDQEAEENNGIVTVAVTVLLEEGDFDLKPGYSADLEIIIASVKDKNIIPITAVYNKEGQAYVIKYEEDKLQEIPVETSVSNGLYIVLESGIKAGDKIMLNTFQFAQSAYMESGYQFQGSGILRMRR